MLIPSNRNTSINAMLQLAASAVCIEFHKEILICLSATAEERTLAAIGGDLQGGVGPNDKVLPWLAGSHNGQSITDPKTSTLRIL